jgi:hypothetical protein
MKAGDVSAVRTSSRETWLSTPLSDPNAALWASITPPANPTLGTVIRRRAAAFSFDMLAHRLHRRFPQTFASRASARVGILGGVLALLTGVGLAIDPPRLLETTRAHAPASVVAAPAPSNATSTRFVRLGETHVEHAATVAPAVTARAIQPLRPAAAVADAVGATRDTTTLDATTLETTVKTVPAKRAVAKKKTKSTARRASKPRRARVTND